MAKKRAWKEKNQNQGPFGNKPKELITTGPLPVKMVHEEPVMTVETVAKSETQEIFEANKDKMIQELQERADKENSAYEKVKKEREEAEIELQTLKIDIDAQKETLKELTENAEKAQKDLETAEEDARKIRDDASKEAANTKNTAMRDASKIKQQAQDEAQNACADLIKQNDEREKELNEEKIRLVKERKKLEGDIKLFEFDKIEVNALKENYESQKELFAKANPTRLASKERELEEMQAKYDQLNKDYQDQRTRYISLQTKMDSIRAEVEDPISGKKEYMLRDLLDEIRELKDENARNKLILEKYPDKEVILQLENEASRVGKLEEELSKIMHDRDDYRQRYDAVRNLNVELNATKRELDATRALNEHLLQELEKNKSALENRTGNVCPSLTKVDEEASEPDFKKKIDEKKSKEKIKDLKELVDVVYNFAGNGNAKESLYYEKNDIRSFLSGMAVSQLLILKGMSGTGKSSLPRIVSKAISGNHSLIPVESSWRDRNELLGYYNDFNKLFNAKSFTIELYRSGKTLDIPSFIVLDEMNLARIEYYFSDFLAILEEPDKEWLVELVSSDMRTLPYELSEKVEAELKKPEYEGAYDIWMRKKQLRNGNNKVLALSAEEESILRTQLAKLSALIGAKDLIDGRKIRVPRNVWFIGTANEDESTFEISDKVYDRAQVVILNKKGKPEQYDNKVIEHFVSTSELLGLFDKAIKNFKYGDEVKKRLEKVDDVLINKFNVSFGNRIVSQATKYAAVFTAAGGDLDKAMDYQISTKILRKVYHSDDPDAFSSLLNVCDSYELTSEGIMRRIDRLGR